MAKETNVELNLTPFIGLFAMLVVLLLVTAVWNQVEVLSSNTSNSTASSSSTPPPIDDKKKIELTVTVMEVEVQVSINKKVVRFPLIAGQIDEQRMSTYFQQLKQMYPEKEDIILYTDNRSPYRNLIGMFDLLIGVGFPDVGVSTQ